MFAFFPWLIIDDDQWSEDLTFGRFSLMPYRRGKEAAGQSTPVQELIDKTLEHYLKCSGRGSQPVSTATLVAVDGNLQFDYSDGSLPNELFAFKEIVAFSGLAIRSLAWQYTGSHCNTTCFDLQIQGQCNPKFGVTRTSRQYGGWHTTFGMGEVHCPHFAAQFTGVRLDAAAIRALWKRHEPDKRSHMETAIKLFNNANTDSDQKEFYEELIDIVSAMEYLLEVKGEKKGRLFGDSFEKKFCLPTGQPRVQLDSLLRSSDLKHKYRQGSGVLQVWAWDLYRWRGYFAHGEIIPDTSKIARDRHHILGPDEHLLLAKFAFPRLVKAMLNAQGAYTLTENDRDEICLFEDLIALDFDRLGRELRDDQPNVWDKAFKDLEDERDLQRMVARVKEELADQGAV